MLTLIINAQIMTMNPDRPSAWGLLIENGRIIDIMPDVTIREWVGIDRAIDARGRLVVPGFNDCHMHILPYGLDLSKADLSTDAGVRDVPTLCRVLRKWAEANPRSEWILGSRYDQNTFPGAKHPTRSELDAAFPDRPVYIRQISGHAASCNSIALKMAGVTRETPDPKAGEFVRDSAGEPTGVLLESAMECVANEIPKPDRAEMADAIVRANRALIAKGITSASDLMTGWLDLSGEIAAYWQAFEDGARVRMTAYPHAPAFGGPDMLASRSEFALMNDFEKNDPAPGYGGFRLGPIKLFSDGALTTRTAALREPYVDGSGLGMLLHEPGDLKEYVRSAHKAQWQIAVHAIGDRAIELVLDAYSEAQSTHPRPGARHRIEHAMLLDDGLIRRFKEQQVVPVVQPEFIARLGDAYVLGLGEERAARLNPTASLQKAGIGVPFSSDCPIVPGAPLDGIRAACRRTTPSGRLLGPDERITAEQAIRNYTYSAAYSTFDELNTGSIRPGLRADLTILDGTLEDPGSLSVAATMIGGEFVYGGEIFQ